MSEPAMAIVGTGAVGSAIGRLLHLRGRRVAAVAGRHPDRAARAAAFIRTGLESVAPASAVSTVTPVTIDEIPRKATRVLIAVSDGAIPDVADALAAAGFTGVALHTCGARGPEALASLQRAGVACGVLHPLQTIPNPERGVERLAGIGYGLAGDPGAVAWGRELIGVLGGFEIPIAPDRMPLYHASAVLSGNGIVTLLEAASRLMQAAGVDARTAGKALEPLARTSVENVGALGAERALTGPVARGDAETVRLHMDALADAAPDIRALYRAVGLSALQIAQRRGLPATHVDAIADILEPGVGGRP